jgi:hypothetical protein
MTLFIIAIAIFLFGGLCGLGLAVAIAGSVPGNDKEDDYQKSQNWGAQ